MANMTFENENISLKFNITSNYSIGTPAQFAIEIPNLQMGIGLDNYEINPVFIVLIVSMYVIATLVAVGGNIFVCYTVCTVKMLRTVTNFFLTSLSVSDILMTILCVPTTILSNIILQYWVFGPFMCPIIQYMQLTVVLQRAFVMVAVTCDRHFIISRPLRKRIGKKTAKTSVVLLWIAAALIALPSAIHAKVKYLPLMPGSQGLCIEQWYHRELQYTYSITILLLQYFLPLVIMIGTYVHIGYIIWMKKIPGEPDRARDRKIILSKKKSLKMLFVVVTLYAIVWLPIHVLTLIGESDPSFFDQKYVYMLWLCFHWLAFSNSAINPLIYCWMNNNFRRRYKSLLKKICERRKHRRSSKHSIIYSPQTRRSDNFTTNTASPNLLHITRRVRFHSDNSTTNMDVTAI